MYTTSILSIAALAATVLSSPAPLPSVTGTGDVSTATPLDSVSGTEDVITATALGGALAPTQAAVENVEALAAPPKFMTISVINKHGAPLTTAHASNKGAPSPVSGHLGHGTLAKGATGAFAVPTGWAGNVAIGVGGSAITGDDSLIEASFDKQGHAVAIPDIDVSYVNGFSVPITCACVATHKIITGCNKDLFALNHCPDNDGQKACKNPLRSNDGFNLTPTKFFAPCKGAAYTYPHDDKANANGVCQSGVFRCCVGSSCAPNPKQPKA